MMWYREESRIVFLLCPIYTLEDISDLRRRLKNAGKITRYPLDILMRLTEQKGSYPSESELYDTLAQTLCQCDAIYLVNGWKQDELCRKLYELAYRENKLTLKIKGWNR